MTTDQAIDVERIRDHAIAVTEGASDLWVRLLATEVVLLADLVMCLVEGP